MANATGRDVAKLAGVSISSVSRAFRDDTYISKSVKERVFKAAEQLGYTPNLMARSLKNQKSHIIGLIISDIDNPFYSSITRVIEAELKRVGYRLLLSYSNENTEQEADELNLLTSSRVDGIIFTPASSKNQALVKQVMKQNIALVQMFRQGFSDLDSVLVDDRRGAYLATKHLLQNGHKDIMLLSVESPISPNRAEGYKQAMKEEGLPVNERMIMHLPFQMDLRMTIYNKIVEMKPTALIAGTNTIGMDFIKVCKENKISIPDDISLIMFDDIAWAGLLDITTISQPIDQLGVAACRTIIDRIEKKKQGEPVLTTFEPFLISRNSVKNKYLQ